MVRCRFAHALFLLIGALAGCAGSGDIPHTRLGALPFPGLLTLYTPSEVSELGLHHSTSWGMRPFQEGEGARGIVYTCRAGFLDIAHIRESIDWTRYIWRHARPLLESGGGSFRFRRDDTQFELVLTPPSWWSELAPVERASLVDAAAIRAAQRAAYQEQTWHEVGTWFGWSNIPLISEDGSAFTWEDTMSHLVGVTIGGQVLAASDNNCDLRTGDALRSMLVELGAVERAMVDRAARQVEGRWWRDGVAVRRDLEIALDGSVKVPWLVADLEVCSPCEPVSLTVPSLSQVNGRDLSAMYQLRITPPAGVFARACPGQDRADAIVADRDFPRIMERIREQMMAKWGGEVDRP